MTPDQLERLILQAWFCQQEAQSVGDWDEAAYQDGRIDAYQQMQRIIEQDLSC